MPYPLKIKPQGKYKYFQQREEWKVTDILFNPMVMMMLLPLLLVTVLPKMMQVQLIFICRLRIRVFFLLYCFMRLPLKTGF
jgi:Protein of unknown function (DUF2012)